MTVTWYGSFAITGTKPSILVRCIIDVLTSSVVCGGVIDLMIITFYSNIATIAHGYNMMNLSKITARCTIESDAVLTRQIDDPVVTGR